jgi:hypothetical protein
VHADVIALGFLALIELEIRPVFNEKNDVVDHIGIGYGDGQISSRFEPREGLIALDHGDRPYYVPQIDFHLISIGLSCSSAINLPFVRIPQGNS